MSLLRKVTVVEIVFAIHGGQNIKQRSFCCNGSKMIRFSADSRELLNVSLTLEASTTWKSIELVLIISNLTVLFVGFSIFKICDYNKNKLLRFH